MDALDWLFSSGEDLLPTALSAGGYLLQRKALQDAQKRRQQAFAQIMAADQGYGAQQQALIQRNAEQYAPAPREATRQAAEGRVYDSLSGALVSAREAAPQLSEVGGKVSQDYLLARARAAAADTQAGADRARMMAKMRSTTDQGLDERIAGAGMANELNSIGSARRAAMRTGQLAADSAGQPSGGMMLAGDLARMGASSLLGRRLSQAAAQRPAPGSMWQQ